MGQLQFGIQLEAHPVNRDKKDQKLTLIQVYYLTVIALLVQNCPM